MNKTSCKSESLWRESNKYIAGGVNSPVRAFKSVGGHPVFIRAAAGSKLCDADGNEYIDYLGSWGPMILGHAHPEVVNAVQEACSRGTSFGAPTEGETALARLVIDAFPSIEQLRMVSSGTEAAMTAIRLARGFTGRNTIVKFEGCYHGHSDSLLVKAGSGGASFGIPDSLGVPPDFVRGTLTVRYNDLDSVNEVVTAHHRDIACIIVEPVAGNMGVIPPLPGFLEGLREVTQKYGILLIFDEVITGFRVTYGGYQSICAVNPDITILGKIVGGGLPVGVLGGRGDIMSLLAPQGGVYQAGTLSGNPVAVAAGTATLTALAQEGTYKPLEERTAALTERFKKLAGEAGIKICVTRVGSMFSVFFSEKKAINNYQDVMACDTGIFNKYFHGMLRRGVYLPPSQFEANFVSLAHSSDDIEKTLECAREVFYMVGGRT